MAKRVVYGVANIVLMATILRLCVIRVAQLQAHKLVLHVLKLGLFTVQIHKLVVCLEVRAVVQMIGLTTRHASV